MAPSLLLALALAASGTGTPPPADAPAAKGDAQTAAAPEQPDPRNEVKCKRMSVTGSRVRRVKVCKTIAEWESSEELNRRTAKDTIESGNTWGVGSPGQ